MSRADSDSGNSESEQNIVTRSGDNGSGTPTTAPGLERQPAATSAAVPGSAGLWAGDGTKTMW